LALFMFRGIERFNEENHLIFNILWFY
jgi:hypothetical protein